MVLTNSIGWSKSGACVRFIWASANIWGDHLKYILRFKNSLYFGQLKAIWLSAPHLVRFNMQTKVTSFTIKFEIWKRLEAAKQPFRHELSKTQFFLVSIVKRALSSSIISKIRLIPYATAVMMSNLQLIFFCTDLSPLFVNGRSTFFSALSSVNCSLLDNTDSALTQTLLFGNTSFK